MIARIPHLPHITLTVATLACIALSASCADSSVKPQATAAATHAQPAPLAWKTWSADVFEQAKREHKLVFVDAGIEGCTACRWMHEVTLTDPRVIERLDREFVVVSVDADQQPDVGARFDEWAWPALVFFDANGHRLKAIRGNHVPDHFLQDMDEVERIARGDTSNTQTASTSPADATCAAALSELDRRLGGEERVVHVEGLPYVVELARDEVHAKQAAAIVATTASLSDPVWGGVYAGGFRAQDGSFSPIAEKRAEFNAAALELFAQEVARDHDDKNARAGIASIAKYLAGTLSSKEGTFYSTQRDQPATLPSTMSASDYWKLDDAGRRKFGEPSIDHGIYTDQNAHLIAALAHAADATGDASLLAMATKAADAIVSTRMGANGFVTQYVPSDDVAHDPRLRPERRDDRPYLRPQAALGNAAVALYSSTGDAKWRDLATKLATALTSSDLVDPRGGFFDTTARDVDAIAGRQKSASDNVAAARFLFALAEITHDDAMRPRASATLKSVGVAAVDDTNEALGHYVVALAEDARGIVDVSVAGDASDAKAQALLKAARAAYAPSKIVRVDVDKRYPRGDAVAAYVCDAHACSPPISDAAKLEAMIKRTALPFDCAAR